MRYFFKIGLQTALVLRQVLPKKFHMATLLILCVLVIGVGFIDCGVSDDRKALRKEKTARLWKNMESMEKRLEVLEDQIQEERPDNGGDSSRGEIVMMEETLKADMRVISGELMHIRKECAMISMRMSIIKEKRLRKKLGRQFRSYMKHTSLEMTALRSHLQTLNVCVEKNTTFNSSHHRGIWTNLTNGDTDVDDEELELQRQLLDLEKKKEELSVKKQAELKDKRKEELGERIRKAQEEVEAMETASAPTCGPNNFQCGTGHCIDSRRRCDGRADCPDASDEESCPLPSRCREGEFRCVSDGTCISQSHYCNRQYDCQDGSDETDCTTRCRANEFQCDNGRCLSAASRCNGRVECEDSSDERGCQNISPYVTDASKCNSSVAEPGVITSPNYPNNYNAGSVCFYGIQAPVGQVVELHFEDVDMDTKPCLRDYVAIYDGSHTSEQELGLFCAQDDTTSIVRSSGQTMYVRFVSTYWEKKGFKASVMFVDAIFPEPTTTEAVPSPIAGDDDCSSVLEGTSGTITSPQYPKPYPDNKYCRTMIRSSVLEYKRIKLTFHAFDMELSDNCNGDYLEIFEVACSSPYDPYEQCEKTSIRKLCGEMEHLPTEILLYSSEASLEFRSDRSYIRSVALFGYIIIFEAIGCPSKCFKSEICVQDQVDFRCVPGHYCTDSSYCENGVCIEEEDGFKDCYCPVGYHGDRCEHQWAAQMGDPTFKLPEDANVTRGDSHTVQCQVDVPAAKYHWRINGHGLSDAHGLNYKIVAGGVLFFHTFEEENEGNYTCVAVSGWDETISRSHAFTLTMKDDCPIEFRGRPKSQVVMVGKDALFSCDVPKAEGDLVWLKDGQVIYYDDRVRTIGHGLLRLQGVNYGDNGLYTCRATNPALCAHSVERSASLTVDEENQDHVCGRQYHTGTASQNMPRISSGRTAENGSAPWHVILYIPREHGGVPVSCGASLISSGWVVTAAQCITGKDINWMRRGRLVLGTNHCTGKGGLIRSIKRLYIHPEFNQTGYLSNDIALIEMNEPVQYGRMVAPICLKTFEYINAMYFGNRVRSEGRIVGCGRLNYVGSQPKWLTETNVPYVQSSECKRAAAQFKINITEATICAGYLRHYRGDACHGDSGGSLSMHMSHGQPWTLVGIISWSVGCDTAGNYGFYTNVGIFYQWIYDTMESQ